MTETRRDLIILLKECGIDRETTVAIVNLCKTDENRGKMIQMIIRRYEQKGKVTEQDIQMMGLYLTGELKEEYKNRSSQK